MSQQPEYGVVDPRAAAALEVAAAWLDEGPVPEWHRAVQQRFKEEWPTLAQAVEKLAATYERRN